MSQVVTGQKCRCLTCGALFFDLQRDPIHCPKCGELFTAPPLPHSPQRPKTKVYFTSASDEPKAPVEPEPERQVESESSEESRETEDRNALLGPERNVSGAEVEAEEM